MRTTILILSLVLAGSGAQAQLQVLEEINNVNLFSSNCGETLAGIGDVNGDGVDDYAMGCPGAVLGRGQIKMISGATRAVLWTANGESIGDRFGSAIDRIADSNADGVPDVVAGAPFNDTNDNNAGAAYVLSGADGSVIMSTYGHGVDSSFGVAVAGLDHHSYAGVPMAAIGAPGYTDRGLVRVVFADAGTTHYTIFASQVGAQLGASVANAGDVNGDGRPDLIAGSPGRTNPAGGVGVVEVYGNPVPGNADLLFSAHGGAGANYLGTSVDGVGDLDGDGFDDVIAGAPGHNSIGIDAGRVMLFRGPLGLPLRNHTGSLGHRRRGQRVVGLGDVDLDGYGDYAASEPRHAAGFEGPGAIRVWSGRTGGQLAWFPSPDGQSGYGLALAAAGDPNDDGLRDVLVGHGPSGTADLVGFPANFPGSGEDLQLRTGIDAPPAAWPDGRIVGPAQVGLPITVDMVSPKGTYVGAPPAILAWLKPSAAPAASVPAWPEVHLDLLGMVFLLDPSSGGPAALPANGAGVMSNIPPGLGGFTVMLQGFALAPSPKQGNPAFTATPAHRIVFL